MEKLNKESKPYKSGEYDEIFEASEMASMAAEDRVEYRNSIIAEMERESEIEFAREEGMEKGIEKGIEKGREEVKMTIARNMKERGMPLGDIMLFTGLSRQQIEAL